jgi:hypothetical protein
MPVRSPDSRHTFWSDPEGCRARLAELPAAPAALADAIEEFVIHHAVADQLGVGVPAYADGDRSLRRGALLWGEAVRRDPRPLTEHRALPDYLYVTCRDFALLAVSALRERGVAARLRVGFASYFRPGSFEDHWICEHQTGGTWKILDAQLGPRAREGFGIGFDVADVPLSGWQSAPAVWRAVRSGKADARVYGLVSAGIAGEWWIAASVLRDAAALAGIEALPWDRWSVARSFHGARTVTLEQARDIDALAEALDPAPGDRTRAAAVLERFPWAAPSGTDLEVLEGSRAP